MYSVVIKENSPLKYGLTVPFSIIIVFCIALSLIPLEFGFYGKSGAWCWIKNEKSHEKESLLLRIGLAYCLVWGTISFNTVISLLVSKKLTRLIGGAEDQFIKRIKYYPMMLFIVYTPITICRVIEEFGENIPEVNIISFIINSLEGFCNFLIFVNHQDVKLVLNRKNEEYYCFVPSGSINNK
jgi:hypothetical protein